jgi:hypothetical protein
MYQLLKLSQNYLFHLKAFLVACNRSHLPYILKHVATEAFNKPKPKLKWATAFSGSFFIVNFLIFYFEITTCDELQINEDCENSFLHLPKNQETKRAVWPNKRNTLLK